VKWPRLVRGQVQETQCKRNSQSQNFFQFDDFQRELSDWERVAEAGKTQPELVDFLPCLHTSTSAQLFFAGAGIIYCKTVLRRAVRRALQIYCPCSCLLQMVKAVIGGFLDFDWLARSSPAFFYWSQKRRHCPFQPDLSDGKSRTIRALRTNIPVHPESGALPANLSIRRRLVHLCRTTTIQPSGEHAKGQVDAIRQGVWVCFGG
jgi:hypothetical protein